MTNYNERKEEARKFLRTVADLSDDDKERFYYMMRGCAIVRELESYVVIRK